MLLAACGLCAAMATSFAAGGNTNVQQKYLDNLMQDMDDADVAEAHKAHQAAVVKAAKAAEAAHDAMMKAEELAHKAAAAGGAGPMVAGKPNAQEETCYKLCKNPYIDPTDVASGFQNCKTVCVNN